MSTEFNDMERIFSEGLHDYEATPSKHVWENIQKANRKGLLYYLMNNKVKTAALLLLLLLTGTATYYYTAKKSGSDNQEQVLSSNTTISENKEDIESKNRPTLLDNENESKNSNSDIELVEAQKLSGSSNKKTNSTFRIKSSGTEQKIKGKLGPSRDTKAEPDLTNEELVEFEYAPVNLKFKEAVKLKYLIYPSLMQYVYTSKKLFKKYNVIKSKDKDREVKDLGHKYSIEIIGGPSYAFRKLSGNNTVLRDESEKVGLTLLTGLKVSYHLNPSWSIQTGLVVENRNERVRFEQTEIQTKLVETPRQVTVYHPVLPPRTHTVIDSSYVNENKDFKFNVNNKYVSFNIPLVLGYNFTLGKMQYRVSAGSLINVYSSNSAQILVREGNEIILAPYKESTKIKPSCYAAFGLQLPLTHNLNLLTEVSCFKNLSNRLNSESPIKQKNFAYNLNFGFQFNILK